jgi:hypothetical protein
VIADVAPIREVGCQVPKGAAREDIPAFVVRYGQEALTLLHQLRFSPRVGALAVEHEMAYVTTGGKAPQLAACHLADATTAWQTELPEVARGLVAMPGGIVTYASIGAVGRGSTLLRFLDLRGDQLANVSLPDVPSEVVAAGAAVYAGCRDGKLYAFSPQGKLLWSYTVPGSKASPQSVYTRPCPYYVRAGTEIVAFSSFDSVFVLSSSGGLRWRWSVPEQETILRPGSTMSSTGPALVRGLAVAGEGSRVIAAAGHAIYELEDGKVGRRITHKDKPMGHAASSRAASSRAASSQGSGLLAVRAGEEILILQDGRVQGCFVAPPGAALCLNAQAGRVAAWRGRDLAVANVAGEMIAEIEFAKRISHVQCQDDGRVVVAAGHLVVLGTSDVPVAVRKRAEMGQLRGGGRALSQVGDRQASEQGIPVRWIEAVKTTTAGKARYRGRTGRQVTIEQLALEHYAGLGYAGAGTENEYWWAIMSLLFWDVIFARIPGAFGPGLGDVPNKWQDMPRDLAFPDFYRRRAKLIQKRTRELTQPRWFGMRKPDIEAELRSSFRRHRDMPCRLLDWSRYPDVEPLVMAARVLDPDQLMGILDRLLSNIGRNRSGLPDLFMASADGPLFAEVKSEKERVADHQLEWLFYLRDEVGVPVELCRVINVA